MDSKSKSKERGMLRERNFQQRNDQPDMIRTVPSPTATSRLNLNLIGSDMQFKKFEKLLGDSLERVKSLRKVGLTSREQPLTNRNEEQRDEYYQSATRVKSPQLTPLAKSSMLSVAETHHTESGMSESVKPSANPEYDASYTVEYLLNQNKHLKEEIEMILRSRSKHDESELLAKKISQYRKQISEQEAEISLLKKYNIMLSKEVERAKADMQATTAKLECLKLELSEKRQHSNCKDFKTSRQHMSCALAGDSEQVAAVLDRLRTEHRKSQVIQDLLSCLEKEIYWSSRQPRSIVSPSPRRAK